MTRGGSAPQNLDDETRHAVTVGLPPAAAFRLFTEGFGRWWPPEYSWAGDGLVRIGMEPVEGGACFEVGPHEFRCDWGRVTVWEPPRFLAFTWQIGPDRTPQPDPARASFVSVAFRPEGARTRVELTHAGFRNHGEAGPAYREEMSSPLGWPLLLSRYARIAG
ncbi:SRPBCC family protein [Sabulicella glaciei]|uniref:SRPBCC family protein n=1 Tax=Sabulicella glaciei TaxID=2984948 RepID=A0ABT3NVY6_9PROT|nr:SRPBCC family protein [Roseococcus sp. MDT2-1-1]MCW8085734.1 SRPBCC family protein [Roseococcus sp. MDT2-1-1]